MDPFRFVPVVKSVPVRSGKFTHPVTGCFGPIPVRTPGCFGPIPFRSGRYGLGHFSQILEVGRFSPVSMGPFDPLYFIYCFRYLRSFFSGQPD